MSIKEPSKIQNNLLSNQIKKELNLLPKILREKKIEIDTAKREIVIFKEKYSFFHKELQKISFNIMSLEKDLSLLLIKNDTIKSHQKILLNSINNEIHSDFKNFIKKNLWFQEIFHIFSNFENNYTEQLNLILDNNNELTTLLIGAYSHIKMLQNDFPQNYNKLKNKINNALNNAKELNIENDNYYFLVVNYIKNVFILLDNKEKSNIYNKKIENLNVKKNEIFVKIKLIEEKKKEKEKNLNVVNNYINEIFSILEKYKLYSKYSKTKIVNRNKDKENQIDINKNENNSGINLNISCPNNPLFNNENKNLYYNNGVRNTNNKINYINIDLTDAYIEKEKINNKKTIDSVDDINSKINNNNSILKRINFSNYNNINELEKDIYGHFSDLKNNPLYAIKLNNGTNTTTNNNNILNINRSNNTSNNNNILSKNKKLKKNITKQTRINGNDKTKIKSSSKKNYDKNKSEKKDKNIINENNSNNNIIISQTNTTMTYNNIIINNSGEMNKSNGSNDSINRTTKINHYTSSNYIKKSSPSQKEPKKMPQNQIHKPGKVKLIPYLTQDFQINKENQRNSNESNLRKITNNKKQKNISNSRSPLNSPQKTKKVLNINNTNNKISSPFTNLENTNCNTEQITDKVNQSSYSKVSKKNIYISIKHNKTNLLKENLNEKNIKEKRNKKPLNKIKVNISKKEIKTVNISEQNLEKKISPNKQSSSFLSKLLNSEENRNYKSNTNNKINGNEKQKNKEITKINIDLDKHKYKNKSPMFKQRQYFDKFNKSNIKEVNIENDKINKDIKIYMNNSLSLNNNININKNNCHIIPFMKNKTNKNNINYAIDKKNNSKNIKDNKTPKTNSNFNSNCLTDKNKNEEKANKSGVHFNNDNSQVINNIVKKEINDYSSNKQDYKNHKKSYFQNII